MLKKLSFKIGISLIATSFTIIIIRIIIINRDLYKTNQKITTYLKETSFNHDNPAIINNKKSTETYIAILEIPTINLKQGLYSKESKYNDVSYNIEIISPSKMPDIINSNLILASHSGTSKVSYFHKLYKLKENDLIYIYYNGYKYIYKYNNSYETEKTTKINIIHESNRNILTLITCKNNNNKKQLVYISYLISKEKY